MALSTACKGSSEGAVKLLESGKTLTRKPTKRRRAKQRVTELRLDVEAEDSWAYTVRADTILGSVSWQLLKHYRQSVIAGVDPETGAPQPPLKRLGPGRKSQHRGYKTGLFANTIRMTDVKGRTDLARVRILPDTRRNVFVSMEATRGVQYMAVEGRAADVISATVNEVLDCELEGRSDTTKTRGTKARNA